MDYIEFKIIDDIIVCKYVYNNKETVLNSKDTINLFRYLNDNNYNYNEAIVNRQRVIRYYGIRLNLIKEIANNRVNTRKKVSRINKYAKAVVPISGILSIVLLFNSIGALTKNIKDEKIIATDTYSTSVSDMDKVIKRDIYFNIDEYGNIVNPNEDEILIPNYEFDINYGNRAYSEKANITRKLYTEVIDKYSKMFGLPTNLMIAVATQECGIHNSDVSKGGGFGLFQIQVENGWNWLGKEITVYNYEQERNETITVCKKEDGTIDKNMLSNLEYNVKVACMIMANDIRICNNDLVSAIQMYNSGSKVLELKNQYGNSWIDNRDSLPGDPMYLEHVLSYIQADDNLLEYKVNNGETYLLKVNTINNYNAHKTM